jgi:hypothetical protein
MDVQPAPLNSLPSLSPARVATSHVSPGLRTPSTRHRPFAEVKEVIGGWAMLEVESDEQARAEAQALIEMHMANWLGWEGSIELRRIGDDT